MSGEPIFPEKQLFEEIKALVLEAQKQVTVAVNSSLVLMNWEIGLAIQKHILQGKRAGYGDEIIKTLSTELTSEFGKGFSKASLHHCVRIAETFPERQIVYALSRKLSWTHFRFLIYIEDDLKRDFYINVCLRDGWSTRVLKEKMDSMLFERTAISQKPEELAREELEKMRESGTMTPNLVFRDPYVLNFLNLEPFYREKDLESAILTELQQFISELGSDFAFLARQKMIVIDGEEFYLDLLFYHRGLRRLIAIDLKLGKFKASFKGQMELYLRWLEKYEMREGENTPMGLILCAEKSAEQIELLQLDQGNIRVSEYLTSLPPRKVLEDRLSRALSNAKERFQSKP